MRLWHSDSPNAIKVVRWGDQESNSGLLDSRALALNHCTWKWRYLVDLHIVGITVTAGDQVRRPDRFLSAWESEQPPGKELTLNKEARSITRSEREPVGSQYVVAITTPWYFWDLYCSSLSLLPATSYSSFIPHASFPHEVFLEPPT